jgi:anti-anti-sigma factor
MSNVIQQSGITIIELGPSYDSLNDEALQEFGGALLSEATHAEPPRLIVDLSETSYVGSSFLELLVRAWKRLKERDGLLALCGVQPFCAEVFQVTRLDSLWPIYPTRVEAVAALAGQPNKGDEGGEKQPPG